jgi:very-long-chain (3R)-3-hydroxyacyl-CoA dehydratase
VMHPVSTAQTTTFFTLACTSWGLVEVPRYLFYALNLVNAVPYPLFWLRYRYETFPNCKTALTLSFSLSLFAILYPTGITGEVGCMVKALMQLMSRLVSRCL